MIVVFWKAWIKFIGHNVTFSHGSQLLRLAYLAPNTIHNVNLAFVMWKGFLLYLSTPTVCSNFGNHRRSLWGIAQFDQALTLLASGHQFESSLTRYIVLADQVKYPRFSLQGGSKGPYLGRISHHKKKKKKKVTTRWCLCCIHRSLRRLVVNPRPISFPRIVTPTWPTCFKILVLIVCV